ncbi:MAG: hypothetical protein PUA83_06400 [Clostridiales bacterium]|nr:hypothetical protein [Clostridiales bacterium]
MFDDKMTEAYRSIKAPESLRERVVSSDCEVRPFRAKRVRYMKPLAAAAACVMLSAAAFGYSFAPGARAEICGTAVDSGKSLAVTDSSAVPFSLAREGGAETVEVQIELKLSGSAKVYVSEGRVFAGGAGEELADCGNETRIRGNTSLCWRAEAVPEGEPLFLTVKIRAKKLVFRLEFNAEIGEWTICREE